MAWTEAVDALTTAGIKSATISNNHMADYGGKAAFYTKKVLEDHNIEVIGLTHGKKPPYSKQVNNRTTKSKQLQRSRFTEKKISSS